MQIEEVITRLLVAVVLGGIIGAEREYRDKSAGFRTLMLISMGACLFTIISTVIGDGNHSDDRIASNIVTGIGFIGAGVIFKDANHVNGITTSAGIWVTAAVGMAAGAGHYFSAVVTCGITMIVLVVFNMIEKKLDARHKVHRYNIIARYEEGALEHLESMFSAHQLKSKRKIIERTNNNLSGHWELHGPESQHEKLISQLMKNDRIYEMKFYP